MTMTAQEIFDTIVNHLRAQGAPAIDVASCKYRASNGFKCAVGCLISDEQYNTEMEGKLVSSLIIYGWLPKDFESHLSLLKCMQFIHDDHSVGKWETQFRITAGLYNLQYTAP